MKNKFKKIKEKLKDFLKNNELLYKIVFSIWGIWWIIRAKMIFGKVKHSSVKNGPKILILSIRTIPTTSLVYFDAIFGHAFKRLGCKVKMLYCDGVLDSCDAETVFRGQRPQCFLCKKFNEPLKKALNLDCLSFRQYISEKDIKEIKNKVFNLDAEELLNYQYLGVNVGAHARFSAIRYFLFGKLDLNDPKQVVVLREKLIYAMIVTKVAMEVANKENPSTVFMLHGVYSSWGPFVEYFRLRGIEIIIYNNMPPRFGYFIFNRNNRTNGLISKKEWEIFSKKPLLKRQEKEITEYLKERMSGKIGEHKMYQDNFDNQFYKKEILSSLFKENYKKRFVMYPNLAWDPAIEGKISEIFDDVFSWIDATIEFFKQKKDYQLIIKPHPAELVWEKCSKGIADYILEKHGRLPGNIVILKPDVSLSAYDLVDSNPIGLAFNGTIGLELAILGIPILVAANIHYRDAGVVKKAETMDEYLKLLEDPKELISFAKDNIELAKKYAYFYFFKSMVRVPFYSSDKWSVINWGVVANTKKLLDDNSNVIKICKKIINKEDIIEPL